MQIRSSVLKTYAADDMTDHDDYIWMIYQIQMYMYVGEREEEHVTMKTGIVQIKWKVIRNTEKCGFALWNETSFGTVTHGKHRQSRANSSNKEMEILYTSAYSCIDRP